MTTRAERFAFPAMILGSAALSFGPYLVRTADVAPEASAFWRVGLATLPLMLLARLSGQGLPPLDRRTIGLAALAGAFFTADLVLWHLGIGLTTLANASLLSNAASFLLPLWGFLVLKQKPGKKALLAIAFAAAGTILLMGRSAELSRDHLIGDLLCLGAAVLYTGYILVIDRLRGTVAPLPLLALVTLLGAALVLPYAYIAAGDAFWPTNWTPLIALALGSQVFGQGLIVYAVAYLRPIVVGLAFLIQPAISGLIGALRFGEVPGPAELAGAALVVVALILVRLPEKEPPAGRA
jgi:drug/metabolite transporter (DMT)-like permease